uniref:Uncharacterized protein n=1 Tax=Knipowitschia caucasica TaxID=637954 RepID=A0AAV2MEL9_KNICA
MTSTDLPCGGSSHCWRLLPIADGGAEDDALQLFRRRFNQSENLSSPSTTRRVRQGAGLLERRGSGTLLLDHLTQPRPLFLPPLFNTQRPITGSRSTNPAPSSHAPSAPGHAPPRDRRKTLLRRHSMQPEQMRLLSLFQLREEK